MEIIGSAGSHTGFCCCPDPRDDWVRVGRQGVPQYLCGWASSALALSSSSSRHWASKVFASTLIWVP